MTGFCRFWCSDKGDGPTVHYRWSPAHVWGSAVPHQDRQKT